MENITAKEILKRVEFLAPLESQKQYREEMASFIQMHVSRVRAIESGMSPSSLPLITMVVVAETGCGKTYVASQMAKASGVNFITIDCSTLSRAGWKGVNLPNAILSELSNNPDKYKFDRSIILFDEFDKIRYHYGLHDEGNPQPNFLRMFEGELQAETKNGNMESVDVSKMSFIFAGAFADGLEHIVKERIAPKSPIGFSAEPTKHLEGNVLQYVTLQDVQQYGFMAELCGRIGSVIYLPPLTDMDYRTLIKGEHGSALIRYKNLFGVYGIDVDVTDEVCDYIAEKASKNCLGARSINPELFHWFRKGYAAIDEYNDINKIVLELQDVDMPGLLFEFGERTVKIEEKPKPKAELPDLNFYFEFDGTRGEEDFLNNVLTAYSMTQIVEMEEVEHLDAFLKCVYHYFVEEVNPNEWNLLSVEKVARTAHRDTEDSLSTFDIMVSNAIKRINGRMSQFNSEDQVVSRLERAYVDFNRCYYDGMCSFLVEAIQEARRNWYKHLIDSIGESDK